MTANKASGVRTPNALLLGYDLEQPSFRHRMRGVAETLEAAGWQVRCERFPSGRYGIRTLERRALLRRADVTILHQIKLMAAEAMVFAGLCRTTLFDFDDAIYVRKPRRLGEAADDSVWRKRKFAATCRSVDVVVAGNDVLAGAARPWCSAIEILPTSIDTALYHPSVAKAGDAPTIVWIGSPENLIYLEIIRPALAALTRSFPALKVRIICSRFPEWPEINIERVAWSSAGEAQALATAHIGVMPLTDDEWARGKCAFKLLQYMAAALPCVASPVGANTEAVIDGVNGFHARSVQDWERRLESLIQSPELRARFGAAGHHHAETRYSLRTYQASYLKLLARLAAR